MNTTSRKQPGRPPSGSEQAVRQQLLAAARSLFAQQGYDAISVRKVAEAAQVNPAMIHYYFGSKEGLYEAMLADTFAPLMERLSMVLASDDNPDALRNFFKLYMQTLGANPWMPPLILREVVAEGGRLRGWFIQQFASKGGGMLTKLIEREQAAGRIRSDADASLTALSMVSLAVFPFVAMPVTREVFGMRVKTDYLDRLIAHTERVFLQGVAP
ncbi:MAG TPA: TetR family transcriptional regulator [Gammaproteobacteria bacterium]|nr:TetR family transcriptional regulator [Gammaproteobacteria bacterium]